LGFVLSLICRIEWVAPDGRSIYAAVAETTTDVVLLDGLLDRFHAHGQVTPAADSSGALGSSS
jgi:hypothetical protein